MNKNILKFSKTKYEKYLRETNKPLDHVIVNKILYTMDNYDEAGKEISYGDKKHKHTMYINTSNRYSQKRFKDAKIEITESLSYRPEINYL